MTNTQDAALTPLYDDERIARAVGAADFRHYEEDLVEELMRKMRDQYETERRQLRAQLATQNQALVEAQKYIVELERMISLEMQQALERPTATEAQHD